MTSLQTGDLHCGFTPGMGFGFGWAVTKEPQGVHEMMSKGTYGHGGASARKAGSTPIKTCSSSSSSSEPACPTPTPATSAASCKPQPWGL